MCACLEYVCVCEPGILFSDVLLWSLITMKCKYYNLKRARIVLSRQYLIFLITIVFCVLCVCVCAWRERGAGMLASAYTLHMHTSTMLKQYCRCSL